MWPVPALPVSLCVHRTISDWTSSNEKAVTSLLCTLEELKSELSTPGSSQVRAALPPPAWFLSLTPPPVGVTLPSARVHPPAGTGWAVVLRAGVPGPLRT